MSGRGRPPRMGWSSSFTAEVFAMADDDAPAEELEVLREKLGVLEREAAFVRAGVDLSVPQGRMFARAYEGELSAEAIRGEWDVVFPPPEPSEPERPPAEEVVAHEQMSQAAAGGGEVDNESFLDLLAKTTSVEDVMRLAGRTKGPDGNPMPTTWNRPG